MVDPITTGVAVGIGTEAAKGATLGQKESDEDKIANLSAAFTHLAESMRVRAVRPINLDAGNIHRSHTVYRVESIVIACTTSILASVVVGVGSAFKVRLLANQSIQLFFSPSPFQIEGGKEISVLDDAGAATANITATLWAQTDKP